MASYPSDELAERRARREGRNVVFLDGRPGEDEASGLASARHDVAVLTARVGETVAERDRMAALAAGRRDQLSAAREREAALRARVRVADGEVARVREQLAARTTTEASLRVQATGLHARIHALRAQAAGHDARVRELAEVVEELTGVSSAARADVDRHLAAREAAEEALALERERAAELEDTLASMRAELESLHAARDRTLGAEERARAARAAELAALRVSSERLRSAPADGEPAAPGAPDLGAQLALAAQRLRSSHPLAEDGPAVVAGEVVAVESPAVEPARAVAAPRPAAPAASTRARAGGVRGLLHRLLDRLG